MTMYTIYIKDDIGLTEVNKAPVFSNLIEEARETYNSLIIGDVEIQDEVGRVYFRISDDEELWGDLFEVRYSVMYQSLMVYNMITDAIMYHVPKQAVVGDPLYDKLTNLTYTDEEIRQWIQDYTSDALWDLLEAHNPYKNFI